MNPDVKKIAIIGFGEAGFALAKGLRGEGIKGIIAYDKYVNANPMIRERAEESETILSENLKKTVEKSQFLFIAVPGSSTEEAVLAASPYCSHDTLIVDITTTSPKTKKEIVDQIPGLSQNYVDCAVLGAFSTMGHKVPILASGPRASQFSTAFIQLGMDIRVIGDSIGQASAIKILRSILVKGIEALLLEMLVAADRYGIEEQVLDSLEDAIGSPFSKFADRLVTRDAIHAERRVHEVDEIIGTLREIGVDPLMASAIRKRLQWSADLGLKAYFGGKIPSSYKDVLNAIRLKTVS